MIPLKLALRRLVQRRWSNLALVAMLGLAAGLNAILFGPLDALTHDPVLERVHVLTGQPPGAPRLSYAFGPAEVALLEAHGGDLFAHTGAFIGEADTLVDRDGKPVHVAVMRMRADSFPLLDGEAMLGRVFTREDEARPDARVLVLSHALWRDRFGADPGIVGTQVRLADGLLEVVGVMPPGFRHGSAQAWRPVRQAIAGSVDWAHRFNILLERREGVDPASLDARLDALSQRFREAAPRGHYPEGWRLSAPAAMQLWNGDNRNIAAIAFTAGAVLFLVACINVGSLMLARLQQARLEFALAGALGAPASRVLRPHLIEAALLGLAVAAVASAIFAFGSAQVAAWMPPGFQFTPGPRALPMIAASALCVFVLGGLLPARQAARVVDVSVIRSGSRSVGLAPGGARAARVRVVAQIAFSCAIAVVAIGFLLGLGATLSRDAGFARGDAQRELLTARVTLPASRYPDRASVIAFWERALAAVEAQPQVEAAGLLHALFMRLGTPPIARVSAGARDAMDADYFFASPGAFEALRMRVLAGRGPAPQDRSDAEPVLVINRSLAEILGGVDTALGSSLAIEGDLPGSARRRVVGVVDDVPFERPDGAPRASIYVPMAQGVVLRSEEAPRSPSFVVAGHGDVATLAEALRTALAQVDPELALHDVASMRERIDRVVSGQRFGAQAIGTFALATLATAALGLFAALSFQVAQRRRGIALQMAIGASPRRVLSSVLGEGLRVGGLGTAIGLALGLASSWVVASRLPNLPVIGSVGSLALLALAVVLCALAASAWPALRAARTAPVDAMRDD